MIKIGGICISVHMCKNQVKICDLSQNSICIVGFGGGAEAGDREKTDTQLICCFPKIHPTVYLVAKVT